jgi:alkylation response protein AidB-like acyl-CoA dehydrogenase
VTAADSVLRAHLDELLAHAPDARADLHGFWARQFDLGLAWTHFPEGAGGLSIDPKAQLEVDGALAEARVPGNWLVNPIGIGMVAPTIVAHGTSEQQRRYLRPLFACYEIWCQLFSEPDAGSDVANLATRARRDGDEWVVDGQKVWTSLGDVASFGLLLARTDPDVPKHQGLTMFLIDMHAPGIDVRPLRQMTGDAEFSEIHFSGVRLSDTARVGAIGDGWRVAITTLMNERVAIGGQTMPRGSGLIAEAVRIWGQHPERHDPVRREHLMTVWVDAEVLRLTNVRARELRARGTPGPAGSIAKLVSTELNQRIMDVCVELLGADGLLYPSGYAPGVGTLGFATDAPRGFLRSVAYTIEGGTSEIMRNIIAERVLGLPGEVRVDRDVPWRDVPR